MRTVSCVKYFRELAGGSGQLGSTESEGEGSKEILDSGLMEKQRAGHFACCRAFSSPGVKCLQR